MCLRPKFAFFPSTTSTWRPGGRRSGYTLVEILVALTLTLILMTAVVTVFGGVGDGIAKSRRAMEQFDRLRTTAQQLRLDLQGVTVTLDGRPARPEENRGYLECIEGGILSVPQPQLNITSGTPSAINDVTGGTDSTVGECGDILMFTTRNATRPFQGRYLLSADSTNTLQSDVAEVAWFLRGKTLHRRVLLVAPGTAPALSQYYQTAQGQQQLPAFYGNNDISARLGTANGKTVPVPNSLGDLTKRENRFAHPVDVFPFDVRRWGVLGLPTLAECSSPTWMSAANWVSGSTPVPPTSSSTPKLPNITKMDYWDGDTSNTPGNFNIVSAFGVPSGTSPDQYMCQAKQDATRLADDVVLTNVIGFDVKAWEPALNNGAGGYVDLGYGGIGPYQLSSYAFPSGPTTPRFQHLGVYASSQQYSLQQYSLVADGSTSYRLARVYDSGCFSYENEGIYHCNQNGPVQPVDVPLGGQSTNGLDDDGDGIVDGLSERITSLPYPVPLRGIQITIRCYEPDSRQVRQITIEHDFLPK